MTGRWQEAYSRFEALESTFRELGDARHLALLGLDAAELRLHLNLDKEAEEMAGRAVDSFAELGMRYERAKAEVIRGSAAMRRGSHDEALAAYLEASKMFASEGNRTWEALVAIRRAAVELERGQVDEALEATVEARQRVRGRFSGRNCPITFAELCGDLMVRDGLPIIDR